jgi:hydroxyethylthiazole kinase
MIWDDLQRIRAEAPLVHNITNYVVMNNTANALLAVGASPVMAHASEEVEEMVALAQALVINIGTLSPAWVDAMVKAGRAAKRKQIPIVLDPVGSGATKLRTFAGARQPADAFSRRASLGRQAATRVQDEKNG